MQDYRAGSYKRRASSVARGEVTPSEKRQGITSSSSTIQDASVNIDQANVVKGEGQVAIQGGGSVVYNQPTQQTQAPQAQNINNNPYLQGNQVSAQQASSALQMSLRDTDAQGRPINYNLQTRNDPSGRNDAGLYSRLPDRSSYNSNANLQSNAYRDSVSEQFTGQVTSRKSPAWYDVKGQEVRFTELSQTRGVSQPAKYGYQAAAFVAGGVVAGKDFIVGAYSVGKNVFYDLPKWAITTKNPLGDIKAVPGKVGGAVSAAGINLGYNLQNPTPAFAGEVVGTIGVSYGLSKLTGKLAPNTQSRFGVEEFQNTDVKVNTYTTTKTNYNTLRTAYDQEILGQRTSLPQGYNLEAQRFGTPKSQISVGRGVNPAGRSVNIVQVGNTQYTTLKSPGVMNDYFARITTDVNTGQSTAKFFKYNKLLGAEKQIGTSQFKSPDLIRFTEPTQASNNLQSIQDFGYSSEISQSVRMRQGVQAASSKVKIKGLSQEKVTTVTRVEAAKYGGQYVSTPSGKSFNLENPTFQFADDVGELPRASKYVDFEKIAISEPTQRFLYQDTVVKSKSIVSIGTKESVKLPRVKFGPDAPSKPIATIKFGPSPQEPALARFNIGGNKVTPGVPGQVAKVDTVVRVERPSTPSLKSLGLANVASPFNEVQTTSSMPRLLTGPGLVNAPRPNVDNELRSSVRPVSTSSVDVASDLKPLTVLRPNIASDIGSGRKTRPFSDLINVPRPSTGKASRLDTPQVPITVQIPKQDVPSVTVPRPRNPPPMRTQSPIVPATPPRVPYFELREFDLRSNLSTRDFAGKSKTRYTPSFTALYFNIRGNPKKTRLSKSGLDFRPIPKGYKITQGA